MSPYLMSTSTLAALSDGDDAATHVSAMWRREHITVAQAEEAAVGPAPVDVFSGDAATIHAEVRQLRADLIATDINVMWDEKRGLSPGRSSPGTSRPGVTTAPSTGCAVWPWSTTPVTRSGRAWSTSWTASTACTPWPPDPTHHPDDDKDPP